MPGGCNSPGAPKYLAPYLSGRPFYWLCRLRPGSSQTGTWGFASSSFQQPRKPDQNYRSNKRNDNRPDHSATGPDSQHPKDPASDDTAEDAENDVHNHAIAAALHHLPSQPTRDQSHNDPYEKSHSEASSATRIQCEVECTPDPVNTQL